MMRKPASSYVPGRSLDLIKIKVFFGGFKFIKLEEIEKVKYT
jgi:hypothetical protein